MLFSPLYLDNCIRRLITRQKRRQTRILKKVLQFEVLIYWHRQIASLEIRRIFSSKMCFGFRDVRRRTIALDQQRC